MTCNWEYFDLILRVYPNAKKVNGRIEGNGWTFANVTLDLLSLGIADFQGKNYTCNFSFVFSELAKMKLIRASLPFQVRQLHIDGNRKNRTRVIEQRDSFLMLQKAEKDQNKLSAAHLFVLRRDQ